MNSQAFKWLLNIYPPYWFTGIRIKQVAADFREITVQMKLHWYNRNYVKTHFGGSLYAMTDPFYMLMLIQILGDAYVVWDKAAQIEFIKPGRATVTSHFCISDAQIDEIRMHTADGQKFLPVYPVDVVDTQGDSVARVKKTLYIRRKNI